MKRYVTSVILAWLIIIGIDFLFHASIFASLWKENIVIFKAPKELTVLIPLGYLSFLLLSILVGYLFIRIFEVKPETIEVLIFGLIVGALFSLSNFLGLFSFVKIPLKQLIIINLINFIEIITLTFVFHLIVFAKKPKKVIWIMILCFILLIISGLVIQNAL
jgi:hypothetical protein